MLRNLEIPGIRIISPKKYKDNRGYFEETYNQKSLCEYGIDISFVQDNKSYSEDVFTLRGLHYQLPPYSQTKIVRVVSGRILDVAVDLRKDSIHYGKHVSVILSSEKSDQILIPTGFAHGFITLQPDTEVFYKTSNYYAPESECGLLWNDPDLKIDWMVDPAAVILSEKDKILPLFRDIKSPF